MPKRVRREADQPASTNRRPHRVRHWRDQSGRWHWNVVAGNHRTIATSRPNGYTVKAWALRKAKQALPRDATYTLEQLDT